MKSLSKRVGNIEIVRPLSDKIKPMWAQTDLPNVQGTILDEFVLMAGGFIKLPIPVQNPFGTIVRRVLIPSFKTNLVAGHVVLNAVQMEAEKLIRAVKDFQSGRIPDNWITERANYVWAVMAQEMTGKSGLLNKYLLGFRVKFSAKGHIATSHAINYDEIGLPTHIHECFLEEWEERMSVVAVHKNPRETRPYVVSWRNPLLHGDSMRKLYITSTESNRFVIHPIITAGMGADSDGDLMEAVLGYPDIILKEDWSTAKFDKELLILDQNPKPDLANIQADIKRRLAKFIVLGPHDLADPDNSETLKLLAKADDLNLPDLVAFFHGKKQEAIVEDDEAVARGVILQKGDIGKIGAAANRARMLANGDPIISRAADIISERATQYLMDSKHKMDPRYVKLSRVLRKDKNLPRDEAEKLLRECNIEPEEVAPYLNALYAKEGSLNQIIDVMNPTFFAVFDPMATSMEGNVTRLADSVKKIVFMFTHEDDNKLVRKLKHRTLDQKEGADVHKG